MGVWNFLRPFWPLHMGLSSPSTGHGDNRGLSSGPLLLFEGINPREKRLYNLWGHGHRSLRGPAI